MREQEAGENELMIRANCPLGERCRRNWPTQCLHRLQVGLHGVPARLDTVETAGWRIAGIMVKPLATAKKARRIEKRFISCEE